MLNPGATSLDITTWEIPDFSVRASSPRFTEFQCPSIGISGDRAPADLVTQFVVRAKVQRCVIDKFEAGAFNFLD